MIRIEAHPAISGLLLTVAGVCTGAGHAGGPCEKQVAVTLVTVDRMEAWGVEGAMVDAVHQLFHEHPSMSELITH